MMKSLTLKEEHGNIQSVLIPKSWGMDKSIDWLVDNDLTFKSVVITNKFLRFRQFQPDPLRSYYQKKLLNGVSLIIMV